LPGGTSSNAASGKETGSDSLSHTVDSSHLDNITTTYLSSYSGAGSNLITVISGGNLQELAQILRLNQTKLKMVLWIH